MISFAIPNYNRVENVINLINKHKDDERISEIVICDDNSHYEVNERISEHIKDIPSVKLITNEVNMGPYGNKARTVHGCSSDWVVLCDSDNFIDTDYIDVLFKESPWQSDTIYCPTFAKPRFDYRGLSGLMIPNIKTMNDVNHMVYDQLGPVFLNTGNYFFNRNNYIEVAEQGMEYCLDKHSCFDVIAFNYFWVESGKKMKCVGGLEYIHDHESSDSIYRIETTRDPMKAHRRLQEINHIINQTAENTIC